MINKDMNLRNNNEGQVLLIVVVAMAVTLGIGLGITSRSTESLKRTGNLDSLQKVTAAAEGGLEKFLLKSDEELELLVDNPSFNETVDFVGNGTSALITIDKLTAGSSGMIFEKIKPSESVTFLTTEFSAAGTGILPTTACIKLEVSPPNTSYMINIVTSNPNPILFDSVEGDLVGVTPVNQTKSNAYLMERYVYNGSSYKIVSPVTANCPTDYIRASASFLLRFQPLSNEVTTLKVLTTNTTVQKIIQGFKITSKGVFTDGVDKTSRRIEAFKYLDTPSSIYDYALFLDN